MRFFERLFDDPGKKIKKIASGIFLTEFIGGSVVTLFFAIIETIHYDGVIWLLLWPVAVLVLFGCTWISAIPLYGFGELIENSDYFKLKHFSNNGNGKSYNTSYTGSNSCESSTTIYTSDNVCESNDTTQLAVDLSDISISDINRLRQHLNNAVDFVSTSGRRAYLQMIKDPVADKLLELPDDQLKEKIIELLNK